MRARYYSPNTGRFISEDSYWGSANDQLSLNLYIYCANNPIIFIDPSGHQSKVQTANIFAEIYDDITYFFDLLRNKAKGVEKSAGELSETYSKAVDFVENISTIYDIIDTGVAVHKIFGEVNRFEEFKIAHVQNVANVGSYKYNNPCASWEDISSNVEINVWLDRHYNVMGMDGKSMESYVEDLLSNYDFIYGWGSEFIYILNPDGSKEKFLSDQGTSWANMSSSDRNVLYKSYHTIGLDANIAKQYWYAAFKRMGATAVEVVYGF